MTQMKATQTFRGNRSEGLVQKGDTFEANPRRAQVLQDRGLAEKASAPDYADKMQRPGYEEKGRSWEGNGSWKTLYEQGEEMAKVQATEEEAEAWANGKASLDEIQ